jgi:hypothetical protein
MPVAAIYCSRVSPSLAPAELGIVELVGFNGFITAAGKGDGSDSALRIEVQWGVGELWRGWVFFRDELHGLPRTKSTTAKPTRTTQSATAIPATTKPATAWPATAWPAKPTRPAAAWPA